MQTFASEQDSQEIEPQNNWHAVPYILGAVLSS